MARYGILGEYLPEFGRIVGQMQHDLFHVYTVDAHTLEVINNARRFLEPEFDDRFPVSSRVARRLRKPELLYIAALYHDIGKGRGGDHSELGAVDAERFCHDHGLDEKDTELVVWLVRNHLVMSAVSQRKDISDPDIIQQFAGHVRDQEHLDYLLTLTVADINGTNPTLWNSLARQPAAPALQRDPASPAARPGQPRGQAAGLIAAAASPAGFSRTTGFTAEELDALWQQRGDDYFLRERRRTSPGTPRRSQPCQARYAAGADRKQLESAWPTTTQIFIHTRVTRSCSPGSARRWSNWDLNVHDARLYHADAA